MSQKILSIQDLSCYGQCSLTVALPILSSYGFETVILPSAILSTHTSGFTNFTDLDLTDEMPKIIEHWKTQNIKVDVIYTGYIGNAKQFETILEAKQYLLNKDGFLFVDPAMADDGKLYGPLDQTIVDGMKKISSVADYVIPNITEACFLTDTPYQVEQDNDFIQGLVTKLHKLGAKNVILTGVIEGNKIGAIYSNGIKQTKVLKEKLTPNYHGTGDVFSSVCLAHILKGCSLDETLDKTTDFVVEAIKETKKDPSHVYGVKFETILAKQRKD